MTPILIPAKNIYRKQYEKLIDNLIYLLQVKTVKYSSDTKSDVAYRGSFTKGFEQVYNYKDDIQFDYDANDLTLRETYSRAYAYIQPKLYTSALIIVPKDQLNKTILSLGDLTYDVVCTLVKGNATAISKETSNVKVVENIVLEPKETSIVNTNEFPQKVEADADTINTTATAIAEIREDYKEPKLTIVEREDYFELTIRCLCGVKTISMKKILYDDDKHTSHSHNEIQIEGTYEEYIPQQINISIDGVVKTVEFLEETQSFGNLTSKNAFVIGERNELMQNASYHKYETGQGLVTTYLAETYKELLEEYKNGKKKLTLLCDINDYYYYDATKPDKKGSIAISRNLTRLTFKEYDEVIPMIKLANGDYVPIAKNEDGTPMVFVVLAIRVFYDGVVWQELTLQQK